VKRRTFLGLSGIAAGWPALTLAQRAMPPDDPNISARTASHPVLVPGSNQIRPVARTQNR